MKIKYLIKLSSISSMWIIILLSLQIEASTLDHVDQSTTADNSPAIVSTGENASVNVTYRIEQTIEQATLDIRYQIEKCLNLAIEYQSKKIKELENEIATIYSKKGDVASDDAKKMAEDIVNSSSKLKKEIENQKKKIDEYNSEFSKNTYANTYIFFIRLVSKIDEVFYGIIEINPSYRLKKNENIKFFSEYSDNTNDSILRELIFNNGRVIVECSPGTIKDGLVQGLPRLHFRRVNKESVEIIPSFRVQKTVPHSIYGGKPAYPKKVEVPYNNMEYFPLKNEDAINNKLNEFYKVFSTFMKLAIPE